MEVTLKIALTKDNQIDLLKQIFAAMHEVPTDIEAVTNNNKPVIHRVKTKSEPPSYSGVLSKIGMVRNHIAGMDRNAPFTCADIIKALGHKKVSNHVVSYSLMRLRNEKQITMHKRGEYIKN